MAQKQAESWEDRLARYKDQGTEIEAKGFTKLANIGDMFVGRLLKIEEHVYARDRGKDKPPTKIAHFVDRNGEPAPMNLGGNLPQLVTDLLVDHVIVVAYVDNQDVGQIQPMKVYEVIDLGDNFPNEPF